MGSDESLSDRILGLLVWFGDHPGQTAFILAILIIGAFCVGLIRELRKPK